MSSPCFAVEETTFIDNVYIDQKEHTSIILRSLLASRPVSASSPGPSAMSDWCKLTFSVLVGGTFREIRAPIYDELHLLEKEQ